jgi:FecR protein
MKTKILSSSLAVLLGTGLAVAADSKKEARVTQIIRDVKLLPAEASARAAALNDRVAEDTGVRTGGESRSELTFADFTITRLGANTIFSFNKAGHSAQVDSGSILLRVPKDSGGGRIKTSAVTVAVTGTTVILESARGGRNKLIVLEGSARVGLVKYPKQFQNVRAAQMVDVPPGATTVPLPVNVDLNDIMKRHPLITDFPPLPSRDLIIAAANQQQPPPSGPSVFPILPVINFGGGVVVGPRGPRGPRNPPGQQPPSSTNPPGQHPPGSTDPHGTTTGQGPKGSGPVVGPSKTTPTPPPVILRQAPGQTRVPPVTTTNTRYVPKPKPTPVKKKTNQPSGPR